jgi:hypothetical protein
MNACEIIELFGGIRPMAKALGHKHPSTVQAWADNESIPHWRFYEILTAARKMRLGIKESDFQNGAK